MGVDVKERFTPRESLREIKSKMMLSAFAQESCLIPD